MEYLAIAIMTINAGSTFGIAYFTIKILGFDASIKQRIKALLKVILSVTAVVSGVNFFASFIPAQQCEAAMACNSIEFINSLKEYRYLFIFVLILAPLSVFIRTRMLTEEGTAGTSADRTNVVELKRRK